MGCRRSCKRKVKNKMAAQCCHDGQKGETAANEVNGYMSKFGSLTLCQPIGVLTCKWMSSRLGTRTLLNTVPSGERHLKPRNEKLRYVAASLCSHCVPKFVVKKRHRPTFQWLTTRWQATNCLDRTWIMYGHQRGNNGNIRQAEQGRQWPRIREY